MSLSRESYGIRRHPQSSSATLSPLSDVVLLPPAPFGLLDLQQPGWAAGVFSFHCLILPVLLFLPGTKCEKGPQDMFI